MRSSVSLLAKARELTITSRESIMLFVEETTLILCSQLIAICHSIRCLQEGAARARISNESTAPTSSRSSLHQSETAPRLRAGRGR